MKLINEADIVAADAGALDVAERRRRGAIDIDFTGIGMLEQAGDLQQRRFAGSRRRHQSDRLPTPDCQFGALENIERGVALMKLPTDAVEEDQRIMVPVDSGRRSFFEGGGVVHRGLVTRSAALRLDRAAPRATTD